MAVFNSQAIHVSPQSQNKIPLPTSDKAVIHLDLATHPTSSASPITPSSSNNLLYP